MILHQMALLLAAVLKLFGLWFVVTALCFWKKAPPFPRGTPKTRFACLIPARNEEAVIGALVKSLRAQNYPPALYDIYVIPNNCVDGTEGAARSAGANIFHCTAPVTKKGDALRQAAAALLPMDFDAFCVFDADNLVHPDFLSRMNDAFRAGAGVAKARTITKNPEDAWVSGCYALYYGLFETFHNPSRAVLGLSARLVGTGFAVHRRVLEAMGGWDTETIAEDAEFAGRCAVLGERIRWVPEAVTWDEAPRSFRVSLTQRRRWCSGIMDAAERRVPELLRTLPSVNRLRAADAILTLCFPFVQALSVLPTLLLFLSAALRGALSALLLPALLGLAGGYLGMAALGAVIARAIGLRGRRHLKTILLFPVFMAAWLPLQIVSALRRTGEWKEIRHAGGTAPANKSLIMETHRLF